MTPVGALPMSRVSAAIPQVCSTCSVVLCYKCSSKYTGYFKRNQVLILSVLDKEQLCVYTQASHFGTLASYIRKHPMEQLSQIKQNEARNYLHQLQKESMWLEHAA